MYLYHSPRSRQQGASLIVALIFLVVLTAAGITAVRLATNEERMAGSSQARGGVFQLAQSEINAQMFTFNNTVNGKTSIHNRQPLLDARDVATNAGETDTTMLARFPQLKDFLDLTAISTTANTSFDTKLRILGQFDCGVLGLGDSFEQFTCRNYEMSADARLANGTYSNQTQGLYFINLN